MHLDRYSLLCPKSTKNKAAGRRAPGGFGYALLTQPSGVSAAGVRLDKLNRLLYRRDFFCFIVGDFRIKLLFKRHHQFNGVQGISAQIINERRVGSYLIFTDAKLFNDDFLDAIFNTAHELSNLLEMEIRSRGAVMVADLWANYKPACWKRD